MHLHVPKPIHGWKQFFNEVAVIAVGIAIALGGEEVVSIGTSIAMPTKSLEAIKDEVGGQPRADAGAARDRRLHRQAGSTRSRPISSGPTSATRPNWVGRPQVWAMQTSAVGRGALLRLADRLAARRADDDLHRLQHDGPVRGHREGRAMGLGRIALDHRGPRRQRQRQGQPAPGDPARALCRLAAADHAPSRRSRRPSRWGSSRDKSATARNRSASRWTRRSTRRSRLSSKVGARAALAACASARAARAASQRHSISTDDDGEARGEADPDADPAPVLR